MRVLIFTASTGGGHKRAAAALQGSIQRLSPESQVLVADGIALSGKLYNRFVCESYTILAKKAPDFYGQIYEHADKESPLNTISNTVNKSRRHKILPIIQEFKPDVIVSCHAFTSTMLGNLKLKGEMDVPVISLITDFEPHRTYLSAGVDHYIVSSEEMVHLFVGKYNLPSENVHPFGIPVFEKFIQKTDKTEIRKKLNLDPKKPVILFMAGSFGVSEVLKNYEDIAKKCPECQFVVITGNNSKLFHRFESVVDERTLLLMFVNNVEDYMHSADLIITKPGGLTVSESLQCGLPMAIYSAFPGQEAGNANYLVRSGAAVLLDKNPGDTVSNLLNDKNLLTEMSQNCQKICPRNSSEKIISLMEKIVRERNSQDISNE